MNAAIWNNILKLYLRYEISVVAAAILLFQTAMDQKNERKLRELIINICNSTGGEIK